MTRLPDAAWWDSAQFSTGELPPGSPGFSMSREEMMELFRVARIMQDQINEQFAAQRAMIDIQPPSDDPASHIYLGGESGPGARGVGEAYTTRLDAQAQYLRRLVGKLSDALSTVEGIDAEAADSAARVDRTI